MRQNSTVRSLPPAFLPWYPSISSDFFLQPSPVPSGPVHPVPSSGPTRWQTPSTPGSPVQCNLALAHKSQIHPVSRSSRLALAPIPPRSPVQHHSSSSQLPPLPLLPASSRGASSYPPPLPAYEPAARRSLEAWRRPERSGGAADLDDGIELYGQSVSYTATVPPTGATQASPARTSLPTVLKKGPPLPPPLLRLELTGHRGKEAGAEHRGQDQTREGRPAPLSN